MNAITRYDMTPKQISLVKNTVAKDCNNEEFDLFIEVARAKGLDPFLGQIIPMVFNKDKADKRKLTIIISRDGQRVIAQRCGDYRPASKPPVYEIDKDLISPLNPQGIISATTFLWKQDQKSGDWYEVAGQSFWEEFAPVSDEWVYDQDAGKRKPSGKKTLDSSGNWCRMPRLMIAKCAEMQALRAGWPEQFTGLYDEAELDRAKVLDMTATELVEQERQDNRMRVIGGSNSITVWWDDGFALENVPDGQFADRVVEHINATHPSKIAKWRDANRAGLQTFWARHPGDALALRKLIDAAIEKASSDKKVLETVTMAGG
ncbi:phage recombination protein Bet [Agrobacterium vitis]|uniref:Phage recombination protein Bet n=1 Tax=Agrobacterium vitis TaxID=373 RepID=A0A7J4WXI8_AGRVI|nr:phage recombination protein Bet [Agrobacterium vitis]KAA3518862.1 phage recombination protein Bet [Agrobacterium vitis]MUZ95939.1 phage recombination protein Bet [Agrobacterium vitis]